MGSNDYLGRKKLRDGNPWPMAASGRNQPLATSEVE